MADFLELLRERIVLGDGATGTYLYELGAPANHCLEELNLTRPELVSRLYLEYADAGSQVIETNSFGANRARLARFGLEDRAAEIAFRAAQVAREALRGRDAFASPGGRRLFGRRPAFDLSRADHRAAGGRLRSHLPGNVHRARRVAAGAGRLSRRRARARGHVAWHQRGGAAGHGRDVSRGRADSAAGGRGRRRAERHLRPAGVPEPAFQARGERRRPALRFPERGQAGVLRGPIQLRRQRRLFRRHAAAMGCGGRATDRWRPASCAT
jgi:hypothetical protein